MRNRALTLLAALLAVTFCLADDEKKPGLKPGDDLPGPFRPYNVTGKYGERTVKELGGKEKEVEGQFHCLVCEHGLGPMVMVFVRNADLANPPDALVSLLKGLNAAVGKQRRDRLGAFAVFLSDALADVRVDDEKRSDLSRKLRDNVDKAADLNLGQGVVLALESKKYLTDYPLEDNMDVTVVLARGLRVVEAFTFTRDKPLTEEDVKAILARVGTLTAPAK